MKIDSWIGPEIGWISLGIGTIITAVLIAALAPIGTVILKGIAPQPFYLYAIPLAILVFAGVGLGGLRRIKVAHKGVLLLVGKRLKSLLFLEGWHWIPPLITAIEEVDIRKLVKDIPKTIAVSKDQSRITVDVTIEYQIVNPYDYLSIGEGVIEKGLTGLTEQVLRLVAIKKNLDEALGMQQELNGVLWGVLSPGKESSDKAKQEYGISDEIDKATKGWGIDVINVFVAEVQPPEKVMEELERFRKEKAQRRAEEIETAHTINMLNKLQGEELEIKEKGVKGVKVKLKTPLASEAAVLLFQTERAKVTKQVDEKRIVIPEETGKILKEIAEAIMERREKR